MIYLQLFLSFLQIGVLSFGGGYAAMPLIEAQIVTMHGWLDLTEFANLVTIAEMTPGPIAVNAATFVGTKIAGVPGALVATFGCILPACVLVTLIAKLYLKYRNLSVLQSVLGSLRPAVVAMIASAGVTILLSAFWGGRTVVLGSTNLLMVFIFALSLLLLRKTKLNAHRRHGAGRGFEPDCGALRHRLSFETSRDDVGHRPLRARSDTPAKNPP